MIEKPEIDQMARELGVGPPQIQKDYIFGWTLREIYSDPELAELLILKGGNCLRKAYFKDTRYSDDLDFGTPAEIDPRFLADRLKDVCTRVAAATDVALDLDRISVTPKRCIDSDIKAHEGRIYFNDFYGNTSSIQLRVQLDITEFDRLHLPVQTRPLVHPYSDSHDCNALIRCVKLEELLASKLRCMLQRGFSKDLFDLVFWVIRHPGLQVDLRAVLNTFFAQTAFAADLGGAKIQLLRIPLERLREGWRRYIVCPVTSLFEFEDGWSAFTTLIERVFETSLVSPFGSTRIRRMPSLASASSALFDSGIRAKILEAAEGLRLLKIEYDNFVRVVEPYALTFKRRRDGVAREYFYCWNLSGGRSEPGIRSFIPSKLRSIEVLPQTFEPRFPVELSPTGHITEGYFARDFASSRRGSRPKRRRPTW